MLGLKAREHIYLGCYLTDEAYTIVGWHEPTGVVLYHREVYSSKEALSQSLLVFIESHSLYGAKLQLILAPSIYQLLFMDALNVSDAEMSKAIRWRLKGLIDYPLNDVAVDVFPVPSHGMVMQRNKIFVAVTPQKALVEKADAFEEAFIDVEGISIIELALAQFINVLNLSADFPVLVLTLDKEVCSLHVFVDSVLYLTRRIQFNKALLSGAAQTYSDMLLEIQRSIDYCLTELKLAEPRRILFSPHFAVAKPFLDYLASELNKEVSLLDLDLFIADEIHFQAFEEDVLYALGGAMMIGSEHEIPEN